MLCSLSIWTLSDAMQAKGLIEISFTNFVLLMQIMLQPEMFLDFLS